MRKILLFIFIFISILIIGICAVCFKTNDEKTSVEMKNTEIQKTSQSEKSEEYFWEKNLIDDDNFKWLNTNEWDKITINNTCTNQPVIITDKDFLKQFNLKECMFISSLYETLVPGELDYGRGQNYIYTFIKDDKKYEIEALTEDIIKIKDKYYKCYNPQALGNAFCPAAEYQKAGNILSKIYYSNLTIWNGLDFRSKRSNLIVQYIVVNQKNNKLKRISELPQFKNTKKANIIFYWHGQKIYMNVYRYNKKEYIEIFDNKEKLIYEQNHIEYSILNTFGV